MFKVDNGKSRELSGVFIVNFEHISHLFFSVSIVDFEQVSVCGEALNCVNIITQGLKIRKCCI